MIEVFALSGLVNGLIALGLGIFIIFHNWKVRVNQLYFLIVIAIDIWALSYWRWLSSTDANSALFWVRMLSVGSTLIPIFYFHWIVSLLELNKKQKNAVRLIYFLAFLFLLFSFSDLFVKGVREKLFFPFWPDPGIIYHFYLFFAYIVLVIYSLNLLIKTYRISSKERRGQIIYVILGSIVAFGGGVTNFFLWYNIPIPPYGNFLVALYPFLFGYATLKYHLFNVRVIATELFTIAIWAFLFVETLLSRTTQDLITNLVLLVSVIIFGILLVRSVNKEVRQREKMEQMAKEVQRAYEVEKEAKKKIEELDKEKTRFMSITSHQLRAPLTVIKGYISMILEGTYGKMNGKMKEKLERVFQSNERLVKLVSDLLNVSRIEEGRIEMNFAKLNLEDLITDLVKELSIKTQEKGIYLKFEKPKEKLPEISADKNKISEVILNILDNAIKYTPKGGITVKIQKLKSLFTEEVDKIKIIISDTGKGITPEEIDNLFKSFSRGEAGTFSYPEGMGLGLYIAKRFMELHHGKIWAESEGRDKGSTFYIELPVG